MYIFCQDPSNSLQALGDMVGVTSILNDDHKVMLVLVLVPDPDNIPNLDINKYTASV